MNCGKDQQWGDRHRPVYAIALRRLTDGEGKAAVRWAVLHEEWRPTPARLLEIAADVASPVPDSEMAYSEIITLAQSEGKYAMPHPDNPNIKIEGPPRFSHPLIAQVVSYCGGWDLICSGEANMQEGLKKQVRGAHESIADQWTEQVKVQLALPPGKRDQRYFPAWKPIALLPPAEVPFMIGPARRAPLLSEMPAEVRDMIGNALKRMK